MRRSVRAAVLEHPLGGRYLTDLTFQGKVSLWASAGFNFVYALLKLAAGLYYRSPWFAALAVYYLILAAARALLLGSMGRGMPDLRREYRAAWRCGVLLFALNLAFSAVTVQMVVDGRGYRYPGYLIFAVAAYAFYSVGAAVARLVRFRRLTSPALSVSKVLGLATALVSILSLQTAMFASFGGAPAFQRLMNALTGGAVCLCLFLMAVFMVAGAHRNLKNWEQGALADGTE